MPTRANPAMNPATTEAPMTITSKRSSRFTTDLCRSARGRLPCIFRWCAARRRRAGRARAAACSSGSIPDSRARTACRRKAARPPGAYDRQRPEARRIRRQHFVGQRDLAVDHPEFELRIGDDDAARPGVVRGLLVDRERQVAQLAPRAPRRRSRPCSSNEMFSSWPVCALVAGVKIGSGSASLSRRPGGSGMPHTAPVCLIILPAGAGQISARDALHLEHLGALHPHGAAFEFGRQAASYPRSENDSGPCRAENRARTASSASARGLCRGCRWPGCNRTPRCGPWRRSAGGPPSS